MVSASSDRPKLSLTRRTILRVVGLVLTVPAMIGGVVAKMNGHSQADPWGAWFMAGWFYLVLLGSVFRVPPLDLPKNTRRAVIAVAALGMLYCVGRVAGFYALGYP